jgi:hypothetical protein
MRVCVGCKCAPRQRRQHHKNEGRKREAEIRPARWFSPFFNSVLYASKHNFTRPMIRRAKSHAPAKGALKAPPTTRDFIHTGTI